MTTITLHNTYIAAGYTLAAGVTDLIIKTTASIAGTGVAAQAPATVNNSGVVRSPNYWAVTMEAGGVVDNAVTGLIDGSGGVLVESGAGVVDNHGAIDALYQGVNFNDGGSLTNGSVLLQTASITAYQDGLTVYNAAGTVANYGAITGTTQDGVLLYVGGQVVNGAADDQGATIRGGDSGVYAKATATVGNFGTLDGVTYAGVDLYAGGAVTNGANTDRNALIDGGDIGVIVSGGSGTVANFGVISGGSGPGGAFGAGDGVVLAFGGVVTNGSLVDQTGRIGGYTGVLATGQYGTVNNFGQIAGTGSDAIGVSLASGGHVNNGDVLDRSATIFGATAVSFGSLGSIANYGTVQGVYAGVYFASAGWVTNGAVTDQKALIEGAIAIDMPLWYGTVDNFGVIQGDGVNAIDAAIYLGKGGSVTNGALTDTAATIDGYSGVTAGAGGSTVTNFGTIEGEGLTGETGLKLSSGGAIINGSAKDAKALIAGYTGVDVFADCTVTNFGTIAGAGGVAVQFNSAGNTLVVETGAGFIGAVIGDGGTFILGDGTGALSGLFSTAGAVVSSIVTPTALQGFDTVQVAAGAAFADADAATAMTAADKLNDDGTLTLSGAVANAGLISLTTAELVVGAAGLALSGPGSVSLNNNAANTITGASAASTLTLSQKLWGAGDVGGGQMTLRVTASGVVESTDSLALILNTGAAAIVNAGTIYSAGAGGTQIMSAVANTGQLIASAGTLTLDGVVTGAGHGQVNAGTLYAAASAAFEENVIFSATSTGTLELASSQAYAGTIGGFALTGKTTLDLGDIGFAAGTTKATYAGTATGGVLTVTDGTHTATIHLTGNYTASTWTLSSDGHGGTDIVDPVKTAAAAAPPRSAPILPTHTFAQAMAGMETAPHAASSHAAENWRKPAFALIAPRGCAA